MNKNFYTFENYKVSKTIKSKYSI